MMTSQVQVFLLASGLFMLRLTNSVIDEDYGIRVLNRTSFPEGFMFGAASSSYQYEGAAREDGKGPSIWDTFTHKYPDKIKDRSNGDVAVDAYHRFKEDVKIIKDMGLNAYRFSISWPRLLPYGKLSKGVNKKGLAYYHSLIDELLANGIKPVVTLFHWDLPQTLEDEYGGFLSPFIVEDFRDYAYLCFREFGNKVQHWITLNEPWTYSNRGYAVGALAPGRCSEWQHMNCNGGDSATEPYLVTHHQLLAHATAVHLYKTIFQASQKGVIGITLLSHWFVPWTEVPHHQNAVQRALDFMLGWFMEPLTKGEYPQTMRSHVRDRLPSFTMEQSRMVNGSFDFLGINYYTAYYVAYDPSLKSARPSYITDSVVSKTPRQATSDLKVYPRGFLDLLIYIHRKYKPLMMFITENGIYEINNETLSLKEALSDITRVQYHHDHLAFLHLAIEEGVNVKGYFPWSLLDNYEWDSGYTVRFGFNYIDYKNGLKKYPKLSAQWYKNFMQR